MKIHLLSDLHLEFYHDPEHRMESLVQKADLLILAGDIHVGSAQVNKAVSYFAQFYEQVLFVPGNHEFYGRSIDEFTGRKFSAHNAEILNPGTFKFRDITFIGATLWTNFQEDPWAEMAAMEGIADFFKIKNFKPHNAKNLYFHDLNFIKGQYESIPGKKVIITHFLPAVECTAPRFRGPNLLNKYFANDLGSFIQNLTDVPLWLFGHTHDQVDVMIGDVNLLANPLGYPNERNNYRPLILEL